METETTAYLALGSNIGDRMAFLVEAEKLLGKDPAINILQASQVYETEPWPKGEKGRQWFLNQVLQIQTSLTPDQLLSKVKAIEVALGRSQTGHWGDREIDIDILLYNESVIDTPDLQIPHRHLQDRQFVLVPLLEIAPKLSDPVSKRGYRSILETIKTKDRHQVTPFI